MIDIKFINKHAQRLHEAGIPAGASYSLHIGILNNLRIRIRQFKSRMKKEINLIKNDYFSNINIDIFLTKERLTMICITHIARFTDYSDIIPAITYYPVEIFGKLDYSIPDQQIIELVGIPKQQMYAEINNYILSDINPLRIETNLFILDRLFQ